MTTRFNPLMLLLCLMFLKGQHVFRCNCCARCRATAPSQNTSTCGTPTALPTTESTTTTSPSPTTTGTSPPSSPDLSTLTSSCPTLVTTDCSKCLTTSSSVTTLGCQECLDKLVLNGSLSSERQDFVLFLCLHGCMPSNRNAMGKPDKCSKCTREVREKCEFCPTQNPSSFVCSCPTIETVDCSKCPSTKPTTISITSSAYPEPAEKKSGLCSDNQGAVIGAAIGGTIFGSILTAIVFVYCRRRSKNPYNSNNDETSRTVRNAAYGYTNDNDQVNPVPLPVNLAYSEINDGMRKSAVISPLRRQSDSSKIDEVYNHLGESDMKDRSDNYDHAGPAPSLSVKEDGYGVLSMESKENDNYNTVDRNFSTDCGKSITAENKQ